MTELLVMSEEKLRAEHDKWESHAIDARNREAPGAFADYTGRARLIDDLRDAMTTIDIPEGCKLAVVRTADIPVGTYGVSDAMKYRRVVQEVM